MDGTASTHQLLRFHDHGACRWGLLREDTVHTVNGNPLAGEWQAGPPVGALAELELLPPVAPSKIICVGRNYQAHAAEHGASVPAEPLLFFKPPSAIVGSGDVIVLPPQSAQVEHEGELAVVIGRRCRNVDQANAWQHVLGLTCANDVTARDLQRKDSQWTRAKGFDTFCPVGPYLVGGISETQASNLRVQCRVNNELRQDGSTCEMAFPPSFLIAYISVIMTLEPGDLILTGTPSGVGPLRPGDLVEVEINKLGVLANTVR